MRRKVNSKANGEVAAKDEQLKVNGKVAANGDLPEICEQTTINQTLRSRHDACRRRRQRGGDSVAHKRRRGDEWQHTKGDAAANGKVAANGDSGTNNNQSHFKVPS